MTLTNETKDPVALEEIVDCVNAFAGIENPAAFVQAAWVMAEALETIAEPINPSECLGDPWDFYRDLQWVALTALPAFRAALTKGDEK